MADEKQDLILSLKESPFRLLPEEIFLETFNYFSFPELGRLRGVSKFFMQLFHEISFFQERGKAWVVEIFHTPYSERVYPLKQTKEQLTKEFLCSQIYNSPQKVDLSKAHLREITDYYSFPGKNIILKNAGGTEFSDFYPTTLLNKVLFNILHEEAVVNPDYYNYTYHDIDEACEIYRDNGIDVNTDNRDFFEHCILYRFNMLPSKAEAKGTLRCFFSKRDDKTKTNFRIGVGCSDIETIMAMKKSMALVWPRGLSYFSNDPFEQLQQQYGEECNFTLWINMGYALKLFFTNPISIALYLLQNPKYFAEDDFQKSCEILLTEIGKFRGFPLGVPDEGLDTLENKLKNAMLWKSRVAQKQTEETFEPPTNDLQASSYNRINEILNDIQEEIINAPNAEYLQRGCKAMRIQEAIKTIEQSFKTHFNNKATCQKKFKAVINSPNLSVNERAEIFNQFKDRIELNRHTNPRFDAFFGIKNTTSWRETWKEIRDDAKQKLFNEVDALPETETTQKRALLDWAKNQQPLFCDHRNNTVLKGAFGRTQAVSDIEAKFNRP